MKPLLALALSGCALMTTKGPEDPTGKVRPTCTTSPRASYTDIVAGTIGGLALILTGVLIADKYPQGGDSLVVSGVGWTLGFYSSSTLGFVRTKRCHDAIDEYNFHATVPMDDATDN